VGFGCRSAADPDEEFRVVHVMQVDEVVSWPHYIARCRASLPGKIRGPAPERHAGDCIYPLEVGRVGCIPLASLSGTTRRPTRRTSKPANVLMARRFWYFGAGDRHRLVVPGALRELSPAGQGHQSRKNTCFLPGFVEWFNVEIGRLALAPGVHGTPKDARPRASAPEPE
jgi:hypothetical protein